ncbi:hypothetical protein Taro_045539 [Colocasia esculenta]|uniref:adenylate kinase n=1 Tax=Colocasia esculenta TaxID=4460 RepID=A0A843WRJ8_COLES|nr:hypothetical protein [Colocasia esculenta]
MAGIYRAGAAARSLGRLLGASRARSFGASAAVRLEYESDEEWEVGGGGKADACGEVEGRGVQWVFMGSPSAQKHVYATRIAALLGVPYISMGGLVRRELHPRSSLYKKIANAVNEGKLVPEDIIFGLLSQRLEDGYYRGERGFILGGIPRTRMQAEILDQITDIDLVVNLKCTEDCLVKKHLGSAICSRCGMSVNNGSSEATTSNSCFATTVQHSQLKSAGGMDAGEIQSQKFQIYAEQCKLLEDYYWKQRKLLNFQVAGGPGETWQGLLAALHLQHIDAVKSSSILTA